MAPRKIGSKNNFVARLVTGKKLPCAICCRQVDDELLYGKLYAIGDIQCHYYCVLLSSCLIQKGKDEQGLFGFLYEDILAEVERCKKHKCSYCNRIGASLGCSISQCRKQFHLPCGIERKSLSLFYGNYKSYCRNHAPTQKIPASIMVKAKLRKIRDNKTKNLKECNFKDLKELSLNDSTDLELDTQSVCVICYENVDGYPTPDTFWPPCCARDAWFHRTCLQRMALSAGMHYLKCPLCNDKENFYDAVVSQGYYVPDRDAAWELEQNAFAEIYERPVSCSAADCVCPMGRNHDAENGAWSISLCLLCGSSGQHTGCLPDHISPNLHICAICKPAAPQDLENLANSIEALISLEQSQNSSSRIHGPIMPSRMSIRRTKRIYREMPSTSSSQNEAFQLTTDSKENLIISRATLNLKLPKREPIDKDSSETIKFIERNNQQSLIYSKCDSPTKIIEEELKNKFGSNKISIKEELIMELRRRFKKPQPLSVKQQIVNDILNGFFDDVLHEPKEKEPIIQWCSPKKIIKDEQDMIKIQQSHPITDFTIKKDDFLNNPTSPKKQHEIYPIINTPKKLKTVDIETNSSLEISAKDEIINIDVFKIDTSHNVQPSPTKIPINQCFKFSTTDKEVLENDIINIDIDKFKDQYLNEVSGKLSKKKPRKRKLDKEKLILNYETGERMKHISINNKNIKVKIKWRDEQMKLHFNNVKSKIKYRRYKQYVLKYTKGKHDENSIIGVPDSDVNPKKRKYIKQMKKSPDNLVQTSISNFFKVKSPLE